MDKEPLSVPRRSATSPSALPPFRGARAPSSSPRLVFFGLGFERREEGRVADGSGPGCGASVVTVVHRSSASSADMLVVLEVVLLAAA